MPCKCHTYHKQGNQRENNLTIKIFNHMNQKRFSNIVFIGIAIIAVGGYLIFSNNHSTRNPNNEQTPIGQIPPDTFKITILALEKDGGHIFDGATIAVIEKASGKIVAEQIADQNGRATFYLKQDSYRFQPSPLKENHVVGFLEADVQKNQEFTLRLTEIGPTAFGAPVKSCEAKQEAINLALEQANYCETNSDCKLFQPGGFSCAGYIHKLFDTAIILQRVADYGRSCPLTAYKCPVDQLSRSPQCIQGKCQVDYR